MAPFGPLEPLEYVISLSNLKGSRAVASGNLRAVALELHEIGKVTNRLNGSIRQLQPAQPPIDMEPPPSVASRPSVEASIPMKPLVESEEPDRARMAGGWGQFTQTCKSPASQLRTVTLKA
jgi:hypothetical protein